MTKNRDLFSSSVVKIPTPHFAVFYNGIKDRPPREIVKLSLSYEKPTDEPELELICSVYNINPSKDEKLLEKCSVLYEYMQFIETVRSYEADGRLCQEYIANSIQLFPIRHFWQNLL